MTASGYDVVVSGGGPAGAAAAWSAARSGARVVLFDKARFPRDKPCGDGVTPRSVGLLREMGLERELDRFHRVERMRVSAAAGVVERRWPDRPGLPGHGYVVARTALDELLLRKAQQAGVEVRQDTRVVGPLTDDGTVTGVLVRTGGSDERVEAPVTIAADGMTSGLARRAGMSFRPGHVFGVAVRAQVRTERPEDAVLECFVDLRTDAGSLLPGYGWAFPMGDGLLNIGIGYMSTFKGWRSVSAHRTMGRFAASLPREWGVPTVQTMLRDKRLAGWRLPMGFAMWPPWRPGLLVAGDAVGAGKPFTGSGISKAIESGMAAGRTAVSVLGCGTPADLGAYERHLRSLWHRYYLLGRGFSKLLGNPRAMEATVAGGIRFRLMTDALLNAFTTGRPRAGLTVPDAAGRLTAPYREIQRERP